MKKQDKYDCRKIKEMIMNNDLSISALSESHLNTLIAYEAECLMKCKTQYDTAFMDMCCAALESLQQSTVPSDERIAEIGEKAYREYIDSHTYSKTFDTTKTKILPTRKPVRILVVTALLLVVLAATVMAVWNPFCNWIDDLKDRLDLNQGDVIENKNGSFTSDKAFQQFASIEEMEKNLSVHIDLLDEIIVAPNCISLVQYGEKKTVEIQYKISEKQILLTIYLDNAPYYQSAMAEASLLKKTMSNREWYITEYENYQTIVTFDSSYVYAVTADSLDTIQTLLRGDKNEKTD